MRLGTNQHQHADHHVQQPAHSIIHELEDAVSGGSSAKRVATLRRVTDLFLHDGERLSDEQVKVFDDVLCFLIARVETRPGRARQRLAPVDYAPFEVIEHLAFDDEIAVAADVLTNSSRLGTEALVEIASTKGQDHLLAISARANLPEAVTDDRRPRRRQGDPQACQQYQRPLFGGRLFRAGRARRGRRRTGRDFGAAGRPAPQFLRDLLRRAKDAVRARLLAIAPAAVQDEIRRVMNVIVQDEPAPLRDFSLAEQLVS